MRGKVAKAMRRVLNPDGSISFRDRSYGVKETNGKPSHVVEVGRRGFERRWRRGTLDIEGMMEEAIRGAAKDVDGEVKP